MFVPYIYVANGEYIGDGATRYYAYPIVDINTGQIIKVDFHTDECTPVNEHVFNAIKAWMQENGMCFYELLADGIGLNPKLKKQLV